MNIVYAALLGMCIGQFGVCLWVWSELRRHGKQMSNKRIRPSRFREFFAGGEARGKEVFTITRSPEDDFPQHPETRFKLSERLATFKMTKLLIAAARRGQTGGSQ